MEEDEEVSGLFRTRSQRLEYNSLLRRARRDYWTHLRSQIDAARIFQQFFDLLRNLCAVQLSANAIEDVENGG